MKGTAMPEAAVVEPQGFEEPGLGTTGLDDL